MAIFSKDSISVQQFKHFKKSITKALDKKLALNKSFDVSVKDFCEKYPFITELQNTVSKTNQKIEQIDLMSVILNNYFNTAWKEKGQESIKLKRDFEKDIEKILFLIYKPKEDIKPKVKEFNSFFKSLEQFQKMSKLLKENKFYTEKKDIKPIELNTLILKIEKLNLLKHGYIQYELGNSARTFFKVTKEGSFSRLKTSYENGSITNTNLERFNSLKYLDTIVNNKKVN